MNPSRFSPLPWALVFLVGPLARTAPAQDAGTKDTTSPAGSQDSPHGPAHHPGPAHQGPAPERTHRPPPAWLLRGVPDQRASFKRFTPEVLEIKKGRLAVERGEPCATSSLSRFFKDAAGRELHESQAAVEERVSALMASTRVKGTAASTGTLVIPVVVHVAIDDSRKKCVPERLVFSQIDALNRDFGAVVDETYLKDVICDHAVVAGCAHATSAAPPCIRFQLARRKPDGQATNGIVLVPTTPNDCDVLAPAEVTSLTADAWPTDRYLNIWVVDIRPDMGTAGRSALGEVQGIGSHPAASFPFDGLIVDYRAFGDYTMCDGYESCDSPVLMLDPGLEPPFCERELGRTSTHELGHWMNLLHPWGEKVGFCDSLGDLVDDTPPQAASNGLCTMGLDSCPVDGIPDMCNNFMDYPADALRVFFTAGQVERMRNMLFANRFAMLTGTGCIEPIAGADTWVADTWADTGSEPSLGDEPPWGSPDLWMRRTADGTELPHHQSPLPGAPPHSVYVRLRNRGLSASPAVSVSVFWSEASLQPPQAPGPGSGPVGGLVGSREVASVPAGSTQILRFDWSPQDPAASGAATRHVGLLARVATGSPPAVGIESSVVDPLAAVLDDNDLGWRNTWVLDSLDERLTFSARAPADPAARSWFVLRATGQAGERSLMHSSIVTLKSSGVAVPVTMPSGGLLELTDKLTVFGPLTMAASTSGRIEMTLQGVAATPITPGLYSLEVIQWTGVNEPVAPVGGALVLLNVSGSP